MTDFPRDELSQEAILRQQLKECREQIDKWRQRLEDMPIMHVGNIRAPFDISKRLVRDIANLRTDIEGYLSS